MNGSSNGGPFGGPARNEADMIADAIAWAERARARFADDEVTMTDTRDVLDDGPDDVDPYDDPHEDVLIW